MEMKSLNLSKYTDELKQLIAKYPDYPIVVLAGECATDSMAYWTYCGDVTFSITEILDCNQPFKEGHVFTDREDFELALENWIYWRYRDQSPEVVDLIYKAELAMFERYWKKVIAIWVDG